MTSMVRWDPFHDLLSLQRDVSRLFSDIGAPVWPMRRTETEKLLTVPSVDMVRHGDDLLVRAEIPGVNPDDIDISVTEGVLTIKGERHIREETKDEEYLVRETAYGSFERSMRLPEAAQVDKIRAEYRDGLLEITIPKAAPTAEKTHKIAIETTPPNSQREPSH